MMQDSPDMDAEHNPSQSDLSMLSLDVHRTSSNHDYEESECTVEQIWDVLKSVNLSH